MHADVIEHSQFVAEPQIQENQLQDLDPKTMIIALSSGHIIARAIHVAARLNIADQLQHGALGIEQIAQQVDANPEALYRLMRLLASYGIFYEEERKTFSLTPLAEPLLSKDEASLRSWLAYHDGNEKRWQAYGHMEYSIKTGKPAFDDLNGKSFFDDVMSDADAAQQFDEGMKNLSAEEDAALTGTYDFSWPKTIVDIGGGTGGFLSNLLKLHDYQQGILFDLPATIQRAQEQVENKHLGERMTYQAGSFFETIPTGGDLYILKRILHDWNDEDCVSILKKCAAAMHEDARLLIVETIVADNNMPDFAKSVDVGMLVLFGGKERTWPEWEALLSQAGLTVHHVYVNNSLLSLIEVCKK
jgi:hypothetical protein